MSNMKCPICGTILDKAFINDKIRGCPKCRNMGNIELWQELIRTKKQLEIQQEFITKLYLNGNITDEQLERVKRKLIKALKQKDK